MGQQGARVGCGKGTGSPRVGLQAELQVVGNALGDQLEAVHRALLRSFAELAEHRPQEHQGEQQDQRAGRQHDPLLKPDGAFTEHPRSPSDGCKA